MEKLNDFRNYLATNFAGQKNNVENLLKIADHISLVDHSFREEYGMMMDYYNLVYTLNKSDFTNKYLMGEYLKDFFNRLAIYYGVEYINAIKSHFAKS